MVLSSTSPLPPTPLPNEKEESLGYQNGIRKGSKQIREIFFKQCIMQKKVELQENRNRVQKRNQEEIKPNKIKAR